MNLTSPWNAPSKFLFRIAINCRRLLPKKRSQAFGLLNTRERQRIGRIYVINLNRQPDRLAEMEQELRHVLDSSGTELWNSAERYAGVDANHFLQEPRKDADIDPTYTLRDQLFVEPQPLVFPSRLELNSPISMSRPEIAVARSHINVWRQVAASNHQYALILEDDVWFSSRFALDMDQAWGEIETECERENEFDILYLSYEEVKHGAPKTFLSRNVFRPVRGLWNLSGYVISHKGAEKLLRLLPCRGPVDLWINHQFGVLDVRATRRAIIKQRRDVSSTNFYSILPALTKIGAITSESASLFQVRPREWPVFAFGKKGSGLSSLAMALSMLGYRCCSDLQAIPSSEHEMLLAGRGNRVFNAYVNIRSLAREAAALRERYPRAKFIITTSKTGIKDGSYLKILADLNGADITILHLEATNKWQVVCEHLRCAPPSCSFPELADLGQRKLLCGTAEANAVLNCETPKRDKSPWVVAPRQWWQGIPCVPTDGETSNVSTPVRINDCLEFLDGKHWLLRDDTFTDNLALFRPSNIEFRSGLGAVLNIRTESLGVREYSAASLTSRDRYLFGRFETIIKVSNVPGVVTGFFLHRDSPRQEIDIEIAGNRTDRLLVNVFYNPGGEGANFDYGYRGAASHIELGFDASQSAHLYAIEWEPCEIRWFVDNRLVHSRVDWDPTPIPHLPMALHVNVWPSRSKELAGRLTSRRLPTATFIRSIALEANRHQRSPAL
ncbi:MAG: family 16 glycosylhydrolase [Candidatus Omnitrophica bacterium]|nr:family 16 glycosylhydrolase [Candidatus Omnitrophota bacterium]MDD5670498.1 family 16 glycosylhydrolase [Candidatus Omnitrophota bacterium]